MEVFEVVPAERVGPLRLGQTAAEIEALIGPCRLIEGGTHFYVEAEVQIDFDDDDDGTAQFIQLACSPRSTRAVVYRDVRLDGRAYDEVVDELAACGVRGTENDIGHDFPGWGIFSMGSLLVLDVDPSRPDDERELVDGVWIGR